MFVSEYRFLISETNPFASSDFLLIVKEVFPLAASSCNTSDMMLYMSSEGDIVPEEEFEASDCRVSESAILCS